MRKDNIFSKSGTTTPAPAARKIVDHVDNVIPFSHEQFKRMDVKAKTSFLSTLSIDRYNEFSDLITKEEREEMRGQVVKKVSANRYQNLITDGHLCLARVEIKRDDDPQSETYGQPKVAEYKTRRSITVCFILQGRYNSRWVFEEIVFSCKDKGDKIGRAKLEVGKGMIRDILACHEVDPALTVSAIDGKVCVVQIYHGHQWNDTRRPLVNRIHTVSPDPEHELESGYFELSKRTERMVDGEMVNIIPGWKLYRRSRTADRIVDRIHSQDERVAKNIDKAMTKLAGQR